MASSAPLIEWLHAATDRINLIDLPVRRLLAVDGLGEPRGIVFTESAEALGQVMHAIAARHPARSHEPPRSGHLEALLWIGEPGEPPHPAAARGLGGAPSARIDRARQAHPDQALCWRLMLELPTPVTDEAAREAIDLARTERHDRLGIDRIEVARLAEGRCAQILHVGTFADESPTLDRLDAGVSSEGYALAGPHHEVYLTDIRLADPRRWRVIIRYPVRRVEGSAAITAPAEIPVD